MLRKMKPAAIGARRASEFVDEQQVSGPEDNRSQVRRQAWSLHRGRSHKALVQVVPDDGSPLYRIDWPDIGLSPTANLARCMGAALEWAERNAITKDRKSNAARRLKSLDNFSWSASPMRFFGGGGS